MSTSSFEKHGRQISRPHSEFCLQRRHVIESFGIDLFIREKLLEQLANKSEFNSFQNHLLWALHFENIWNGIKCMRSSSFIGKI